MDYQQQAMDFATKYGVKLEVLGFTYGKYFPDDKQARYIFKLRLKRGRKSYTFSFGQSIVEGANEPDMYSVLCCLTKYDPESFEWFCDNYGYDIDSRSAERTYKEVCKEWKAVARLFGDILREFQEIS